jgi:Ca2+-binding EF-hand superfamily protein
MLTMFNEFGFDISEESLWKLFSIVNENGKMTLEEFKKFMMDDNAKACNNITILYIYRF